VNYYIGVDLGSTTCKAVILDETGRLIARGLTNTRSNYKVATEVAEREAKINARFTLFENELNKQSSIPKEELDKILTEFEQFFRYEQYLHQLGVLEEKVVEELGSLSVADKDNVTSIEKDIFKTLNDNAYDFYQEMGKDKSRFFRDMVGSQYMKLAEANTRHLEILMGIYDKCILKVENEILEINVKEMAQKALANISKSMDISSVQDDINKAFAAAAKKSLHIQVKVGTGYGRQHLPYPKDQIQSEILCHGFGAHHMFPKTATILDIGGQDTKAIQVDENGIVSSFFMNDRCAAGCGRFLGYIADELNISLHELGPLSLDAHKTLKVSSTCTVFASVELRDRLSLGERREDILAGLHSAIVKRAMSLIARSGGVRGQFTFTGGVAKNQAVAKNVREMIKDNYGEDIGINISPDSIYTGAIGAALFATRK
jgi:benzoyl-CoA reductase subunit A